MREHFSPLPQTASKTELSEYEEETIPLDDVLRQLLKAKLAPKKQGKEEAPRD